MIYFTIKVVAVLNDVIRIVGETKLKQIEDIQTAKTESSEVNFSEFSDMSTKLLEYYGCHTGCSVQ